MDRYTRNRQTITEKDQALLATKHVFVAGCGGLGCYIIELLARLGVGHLSLADHDVFEITNLNRQLYAREDNLGQSKVSAALDRIREINAEVSAQGFDTTIEESNAEKLIHGHDLVMDALDSFRARLVLEEACEKEHIPLVHGAIGGLHGQFALILPGDRLLRKIYSHPVTGVEQTQGNPSFTPAMVASYQVAMALKVLLGQEVSSNVLHYLDLTTFEIEAISFM